MNYKSVKPLPDSGKMRVTQEQTAIVQKQLREQGNQWQFEDKYPEPLAFPFLYWGGSIMEFGGYSDETIFTGDPLTECQFNDYFEVETETQTES